MSEFDQMRFLAGSEPPPKLGACCNCGRKDSLVRSIIFVDRRSPEPGIGCRGCVVCNLPQAGAVAVLCDECLEKSKGYPERICLGSPADNRRMPFSELGPEPFQHDEFKHAKEIVDQPAAEEIIGQVADAIIDHICSEIERDTKRRERHARN